MIYVFKGSSPSTSQLVHLTEDSVLKHKLIATVITEDEVVQVIQYSIKKLLRDSSVQDSDIAICLRISYKVTRSPNVQLIIKALKRIKSEYFKNMVFTVIPVIHLQNAFTFLSVSAIRHEA